MNNNNNHSNSDNTKDTVKTAIKEILLTLWVALKNLGTLVFKAIDNANNEKACAIEQNNQMYMAQRVTQELGQFFDSENQLFMKFHLDATTLNLVGFSGDTVVLSIKKAWLNNNKTYVNPRYFVSVLNERLGIWTNRMCYQMGQVRFCNSFPIICSGVQFMTLTDMEFEYRLQLQIRLKGR